MKTEFDPERSIIGYLADRHAEVCPIEQEGKPGLVVRIMCDTRKQRQEVLEALGINFGSRYSEAVTDLCGNVMPSGESMTEGIQRAKDAYDSNKSPMHEVCRQFLVLEELRSGEQHIEPGGFRVRPVDGVTG